jgi:chromosome segregation ATPase
MVIRTMNLRMITKEFDAARSRIEAIIRQSQGYMDRLTVHADTGAARSLSATLRLPADQGDSVLNQLKTLGRLMQETQNSSDATSQYVDLSARLSNARNSEMRLLSLLRGRAGDLKDVVAMEREISSVRESIERMEAQQKDLNNKIQFVTIQLELSEQYHAELQPSVPSTGTELRNAAVEGIRSAAENTVGIAFFLLRYGPSLAVWGTVVGGMVFLLIRMSRTDRRWIRRQT